MRAQVGLMRPVGMLEDYDGIIGGNVGLVEDEGLFLRRCAFVFAPLQQIIIDGSVLVDLLLQEGDRLQEELLLVAPLLLFLAVELESLLQLATALH